MRPRDRRGLRGGPELTRPVLLVTNHAPPFRVGAFARLHEREEILVALVGGAVRHGGGPGATGSEGLAGAHGPAAGARAAGVDAPRVREAGVDVPGDDPAPFPVVRVPQRAVFRLASSGRCRAVIAGMSGRVALPAAYAGARAAHVPFVLWATIWRHPRSAAHALSYVPLRHIYHHADAIATYGTHVSAYVRGKGPRGQVLEAPQSVEDAFWAGAAEPRREAPFQVLFAGRPEAEKGLDVLLEAWRSAALPESALVVAGGEKPRAGPYSVHEAGRLDPEELRNFYAGSDVVVVPSVPTRTFLEPWGLVVNEAFDRGVPVIATTAVGAVAGGLVQHERTGLVVPPGDAAALAAALRRMHDDAALRARLGAAAREAVRAFSHDAWADGMSRALVAVGTSATTQPGGSGPEGC